MKNITNLYHLYKFTACSSPQINKCYDDGNFFPLRYFLFKKTPNYTDKGEVPFETLPSLIPPLPP